jgi:type VI secretion system protein ImpC
MSTSQQAAGEAATTTTETQETSILDGLLKNFSPQTEKSRAQEMLAALVEEALKGTIQYDKNADKTIKAHVAAIDGAMSKQLAAILRHPDLQKLEGSWRGLHYLVHNSETSAQLKIRMMNVQKKEIVRDLEKASEFDQSLMFRKTYSDEFDMPGGQPFGCLVGDYEFSNHPDDIALLSRMSKVAAAGFCPFISAASHELFGFKNWDDLAKVRDLERIFDSIEYTKWRGFRESEDSRFVTLVLPRTLARVPYGKSTKPIEEFNFEEVELDEQGKSKPVPHDHYTWMNASYLMATNLTSSFSRTGFCTAIRGKENGGEIRELPTHIFKTEEGDMDMKCPTEVGIGDRRENELSKLGFLPLCHYRNTDYAVFFGAQTAQKPKVYTGQKGAMATENAAISARLPYLMATGRFAHYLKVIARDKIGSFMEREDCERWLNGWINNYVNAQEGAGQEMRARYPLREAKVEVQSIPGKPGAYRAQVYLRPWLQFEELQASMRLVTQIPAGAG